MVARLGRLDSAAQETLKQLALFGHATDLSRLSWALERSEVRTQADLWGAVKEGLVVVAGDTYRFAHDRFWEAAYSLVAEQARPALHLRLGRISSLTSGMTPRPSTSSRPSVSSIAAWR
jgi:predicted ATPase